MHSFKKLFETASNLILVTVFDSSDMLSLSHNGKGGAECFWLTKGVKPMVSITLSRNLILYVTLQIIIDDTKTQQNQAWNRQRSLQPQKVTKKEGIGEFTSP